jgi:hypothetical protein
VSSRKIQEERIRRCAAKVAPDRSLEFDDTTRTSIKFRFIHKDVELRKTPVSDALDAYAWEQKSDTELEAIVRELLKRTDEA